MMKKVITILIILTMLMGSLVVLTGCGDKKENKESNENTNMQTLSFELPYDFGRQKAKGTIKVPDGYKIVKKGEEAEGEEKITEDVIYAVFGNNDYTIGISINSYLYYTNTYYKEQHGTIDPSFATYKEYMSSDLRESYTGRTEKEFKVGDREALAFINNSNNLCIEIDYDDYNNNASIELKVIPKEKMSKDEAKALLEDKTLNSIINSLNIDLKK